MGLYYQTLFGNPEGALLSLSIAFVDTPEGP